mgnify:CR=1 FL=1
MLHIKDGPGKVGEPMTAVGQGVIDWKPVIDAAAPTTEWLVVELDADYVSLVWVTTDCGEVTGACLGANDDAIMPQVVPFHCSNCS